MRKEYVVKLLDFSTNFYTTKFITKKLKEILNQIGPSKFEMIVNDNRSNMRKAKEIIENKFPKIKNIRCISHCINLILCDIVQHRFAINILKKVNILATYFRNNAMAGEFYFKVFIF